MQVLYATGFNAWGQLQFDASSVQEEPDDIDKFTLTTSDGTSTAGTLPEDGASTEDFIYFSEALNGHVIVYDKNDDVVQVVAYDVGFAALSTGGQVWTWGDARFPECLGRDVAVSPADNPGRVTALEDLPTGPIVKLAAGGYVLAALTRGRDLYCWGGYPGRRPMVLEDLTGEPSPIVVLVTADEGNDKEADIADIGVGDGHMIVLTADGSVCVIGSNANGQLGLGRKGKTANGPRTLSSWVKVRDLPSGKDQRVTSVYAGPRSSFVVVTES
ncbi:hypothetical protein SEUCBS140593_004419 [Sporothrix eucalyptigena]|uniref:Regulator of chromosome condensation 1/beta-lactamase-inhibitor protein II n=1 Tax=Sporothrix eucalyptigena TaxID=1812306 RepID=A0ABP0BPL6_9PEZI